MHILKQKKANVMFKDIFFLIKLKIEQKFTAQHIKTRYALWR